jgi:hypothetical protein
MKQITTMVDTLPAAPDSLSMTREQFNMAAVTFVAAEKAMVPQQNAMAAQMNEVAAEINAEAVQVAADKTFTQAAAATVAATANAVMWNAATNYAQGACAISLIDFATYRRKVAGTTAADPSADPVNWGSTIAGLTPLQQDRAALVAGAGMTPNANDPTQPLVAVQKLIEARVGDYSVDTGAANAYVIALNPAITAYTGDFTATFKAANSNNGASTINFGAGVVPLLSNAGGALGQNDILAGSLVTVNYVNADGKAYITSSVLSQIDMVKNSLPSVSAAFNSPTAGLLTVGLQPCVIDFRNSDVTNGSANRKLIAAALSLSTTAITASFGAVTGVPARLQILAIDDGSASPRLGIVNTASGFYLDESGVLNSTTAIAGAASSAGIVYTAVALGAGLYPFKIVGLIDATWVNGTGWNAITKVTGCGGLATLGDGGLYVSATTQVAGSTTSGTYTDSGLTITLNKGRYAIDLGGLVQITCTAGTGFAQAVLQLTDNANVVKVIKLSDFISYTLNYTHTKSIRGSAILDVPATTTYKLRFGYLNQSGTSTVTAQLLQGSAGYEEFYIRALPL